MSLAAQVRYRVLPGPVMPTAGFGRRMRLLSDGVHKALLPAGETTILGRIMEAG